MILSPLSLLISRSMVKSLNGENYVYTCLLALYHWTEQVYDIGGTIERNSLAEIKARIMNTSYYMTAWLVGNLDMSSSL